MGKRKLFLYLFVVGVTLLSLHIQFQNLVLGEEEHESAVKVLEYYPFRIPQEKTEEENESAVEEKDQEIIEQGKIEQESLIKESLPEEQEGEKANPDNERVSNFQREQLPSQPLILEEQQRNEKPVQDKEDREVLSYSYIEEIAKEISLKDKAILYDLLKNIDDTNMTYIEKMMENGLKESEVVRIKNILKRVLEARDFQKAEGILDKYIPAE